MSCEASCWFFTIFGAGGSPISIRGRRFSEAFQGTKQSQIFCAKFVAQAGKTSCIFISFLHIIPSYSGNFHWMLELILLQESSNTFDYFWEKEGCMLMASTSKSSKYLVVASWWRRKLSPFFTLLWSKGDKLRHSSTAELGLDDIFWSNPSWFSTCWWVDGCSLTVIKRDKECPSCNVIRKYSRQGMGHLCNFQLSIDASTNKPQPVNKGQEHNILDEFYTVEFSLNRNKKRRRVSIQHVLKSVSKLYTNYTQKKPLKTLKHQTLKKTKYYNSLRVAIQCDPVTCGDAMDVPDPFSLRPWNTSHLTHLAYTIDGQAQWMFRLLQLWFVSWGKGDLFKTQRKVEKKCKNLILKNETNSKKTRFFFLVFWSLSEPCDDASCWVDARAQHLFRKSLCDVSSDPWVLHLSWRARHWVFSDIEWDWIMIDQWCDQNSRCFCWLAEGCRRGCGQLSALRNCTSYPGQKVFARRLGQSACHPKFNSLRETDEAKSKCRREQWKISETYIRI